MDIKKGTKLKLKWQFLNEGEPVSLSDYSKFRLDVLDVKKVPQRTSVTLAENEVVLSIDTEKYENGRFSVRVDADGPDGGLHICHRNAFRIVPANAKSSLAKGGPGENYELTIQDDLSGQTQSVVEEQDPTVPDYVKAITQQNITDWGNKQDALVSGRTIKTLNNESILGEGDINLSPEYSMIELMIDEDESDFFAFITPGGPKYLFTEISHSLNLHIGIDNNALNILRIKNVGSSEITVTFGDVTKDGAIVTKIGPAEIKCGAGKYIEIRLICIYRDVTITVSDELQLLD